MTARRRMASGLEQSGEERESELRVSGQKQGERTRCILEGWFLQRSRVEARRSSSGGGDTLGGLDSILGDRVDSPLLD